MRTFEQFKEQLAYDCMLAINGGVIIGKSCCPLGSCGGFTYPTWPNNKTAARIYKILPFEAGAFIAGYGAFIAGYEEKIWHVCNRGEEQFFRLGQAYNKKFPPWWIVYGSYLQER